MSKRSVPATLWIGLGLITSCEILLVNDVHSRGGAVIGREITVAELPEPDGIIGQAARLVAINMTGICWLAYLLLSDGILTTLARRRRDPIISSIRARPNRFLTAALVSIPIWCFFDGLNFYFINAWQYHGLPPSFIQRVIGYFVAFAAIVPGMLLAAQFYQVLGLRRLTTPYPALARRISWGLLLGPIVGISVWILLVLTLRDSPSATKAELIGSALVLLGPTMVSLLARQSLWGVSFAAGAGFLIWTFLAAEPLANLTLWVGLIFLLDPVNARLGAPSLLRDWQHGRWGRTLALFAGGATCGFLWEFWNYWAIAKWTYNLPFLGSLEPYRYFEMPWVGFLGFLPFAAECWVMLNTVLTGLRRVSLQVAELLPDSDLVL